MSFSREGNAAKPTPFRCPSFLLPRRSARNLCVPSTYAISSLSLAGRHVLRRVRKSRSAIVCYRRSPRTIRATLPIFITTCHQRRSPSRLYRMVGQEKFPSVRAALLRYPCIPAASHRRPRAHHATVHGAG